VGFELSHPLALLGLGLLAIAAVLVIWRLMPPPLPRSRARISLGIRILIVLLLVSAIAGLQVQTTPSSQALIVAADLSASVQSALDSEAAAVRQILNARRGQDQAGVLSFARDPQLETSLSTNPQFAEFQSQPNPNYTDLAAALRLSGSLLPLDSRRHIVLISDGRGNLGDAVSEARLLRAEGIRVDTVALKVSTGAEVYVDRVDAPRTLQRGEQAQVRATLVSNTTTPTIARWYLDRTLIATSTLSLQPGETTISQTVSPSLPGFHAVRVVIDPARDTYAENNLGEALIQVLGPSRVLLVEGTAGHAVTLANALRSVGIGSDTVSPRGLPRTAADLAAYHAVVLLNVSAGSLGTDEMTLLQTSVRDLGTGLVVIGGDDSYGPGGYAGTPIETSLPVRIELPQDMQKPPVSVVLVLESSESAQGDQVVRGAADAVIDQLTPRDRVGITNGSMGNFVVPLGPLTDKAAIKRQVDSMNLGDPPTYAPDLNAAASALRQGSAAVKHVIFLGDGDAFDSSYQSIITGMHSQGITMSTVAIGSTFGDAALLQQMAGWGHGRFYQSNSVQDIPQIFLKETREALKPWIVEGDIVPRLGSLAEILPGVPLGSFPHLTGYVATTPRAAADIVLKSATGDPLLATWQYGLGRVVAWTSDAEGRWSAGLLRWPNANLFFGDLVRSSLPPPGDPSLQVETLTRGDHTHLLVTAPAVSGSTVTVNAVAPDLGEKEVPLAPTGAGRFEGDLETSQVGSYLLHVTQAGAGGVTHATTTGLVVPYSPEYRDLGTDQATMAAVARAGGGKVLTDLAEAFQLPVPPVQATAGISELLLILAILLFPIDVAVRRLIFRTEDLPAWQAAFKPKPAPPVPTEATVARLKDRIEGIRAERRGKEPPAKARKPDDPTGELLARRRRR